MRSQRKRGSESYHQKMDRLKSRATELEIRIRQELFGEARVIACTLVGSASHVLDGMKFGTLFIDEAAQALEAACWMGFIKKVANKKDWIVHLEQPIQMPEQVIQYVGRYSKRACLSEYKITAMDGENISFRYRDYKNSPDRRNPVEKELTLHYREFFPRLLQHVPLRYFRIVRYYGFYSNKGNLPEEYFGRDESEIEEAGLQQEESGYENPYFCEHCGRMRVYSHTTPI